MARADLKYVIGFETNDSDVVTATKRLNNLQKQVKFLSDQQKAGNISAGIMRKGQKQLNDEIARLRSATQKGGQALTDYITKVEKSGKALRRKEIAAQQAGYQIQDFIVQVQGGTNPLVAFSQQASQLAGFFAGPWGAMIGLGIAALSGLAMAFGGAGRAAKEAKKEFDDAIKSFEQQNLMALTGLDEKQIKYGSQIAEAAKASMDALKELDKAKGAFFDPIGRYAAQKAYDNALDKENALKKESQAYTEARNESLKIMQDTNDAAQLAKDIESGRLQDADAMVEEFKKRKEYEEELYKSLTERAKVAIAMYGKEGEAALVQKQKLEYQKLENELREKGVNLEGSTAQQALQNLKVAQNSELQEYKRVEAIKARTQAESEAQRAAKEAERLREENLREYIEKLKEEIKVQKQLADGIAKSFGDAFTSLVEGTKTAKEAFRDMARAIIKQLFEVLVVQKMVGQFGVAKDGSIIATGIAGAIGTAFGLPTADGGGYTGSGSRSGGLDGKGGFLAMLHPNETVIDHTKGQTGGVTVVQNINVSTGVQQTVRTEIKSLMPQIAEASKAAVADAKRRGGSYGRNFA